MAVSYQKLWKDYHSFSSPQGMVAVAGEDLIDYAGCVVTRLEISLCCEKKAGLALITLEAEPEDDKLEGLLTCGEKVQVKLGYDTANKLVFTGYLHQVQATHTAEERSYQLICLDCLGLMAQGNAAISEAAKKLSALIADTLGKSRYTKFYGKKQIGAIPEPFNDIVTQNTVSDLHFLRAWAERLGYYLFVRQDTLVFDKAVSKPETLELDYNNGIIALTALSDLSGQVGQVRVIGSDADGKPLTATAERKAKLKNAAAAAETQILRQPSFGKKEQLDYLAKSFMAAFDKRTYTFEAKCVGIPELLPLNLIKTKKETWEIREATHIFDDDGYRVTVKGGLA